MQLDDERVVAEAVHDARLAERVLHQVAVDQQGLLQHLRGVVLAGVLLPHLM